MISQRWVEIPGRAHTLGLAVIRFGIGENGNHAYDGHQSPLTNHLSQDEQALVLLPPRPQFKRFGDFNTPAGA